MLFMERNIRRRRIAPAMVMFYQVCSLLIEVTEYAPVSYVVGYVANYR